MRTVSQVLSLSSGRNYGEHAAGSFASCTKARFFKLPATEVRRRLAQYKLSASSWEGKLTRICHPRNSATRPEHYGGGLVSSGNYPV